MVAQMMIVSTHFIVENNNNKKVCLSFFEDFTAA